MNPETIIRYADLFCGIGAFHTAFSTSSSRMKCVFACDIDEGARAIYEKNYSIKPYSDIRTLNEREIPDFDVLCAGFPCQPFSIAGNKGGFQDETSGNLFFDIMRIIISKMPRVCIFENVKNLESHDGGKTFSTIRQALEAQDYHVTWQVLNSAMFGSPQARERLYILASKGKPLIQPSSACSAKPRSVMSILDTQAANHGSLTEHHQLVPVTTKTRKKSELRPRILYNVVNMHTQKGGRQGERVYDPAHVGVTICASSGGPGAKTGLYKVGDQVRRLNVTETLRMFGFPDSFIFPESINSEKALFYLGNSIVVDVLVAFVPILESYFNQSR